MQAGKFGKRGQSRTFVYSSYILELTRGTPFARCPHGRPLACAKPDDEKDAMCGTPYRAFLNKIRAQVAPVHPQLAADLTAAVDLILQTMGQ